MRTTLSTPGYIALELTSANLPDALERIAKADISMTDLAPIDELTIRMRVSVNGYRKLTNISQKHGDTLRIIERDGYFWTLKSFASRPILIFGILLLIIASFYLPSRVLFVTVEGNEAIPSKLILEKAQECGISFWAQRREVRSERMKNALLEALPELRWAGINTYGCTAVISVSERAAPNVKQADSAVSSILASRDGVITSATATQGNLLCREGQAVKAGDILISGYQDCGIAIRANRSEGEIFARTHRELLVKMPLNWSYRTSDDTPSQKYSLIFGKKRINLWKGSGISDGSCVRMYEEYYVTLPGGFRLPVGVGVERIISVGIVEMTYPQEEAEQLLTDFSEAYLHQQMVAGSITHGQLQTECDGAVCRLKGNYYCVEMIGTIRHNEIGEYNGKDS